MATRPLRARPHALVIAVSATAVAVVAAVVPGAVTGSALADPRPSIEEVQNRLDALEEQAEAAAEERNGLRLQVAETRRKATKVRQRIRTQERALDQVRTQLGVFAAAAYRSAGMDTTLQLMLSEDPAGFLEQTSSLSAVARGQQSAMRRAAAARLQLDQSRLELAETLEQQKKAEAEASAKTRAIEEKKAEAEALLSSLEAAERRRLEALQAERAARAQQASRDAIRSVPAPQVEASSSSRSTSSGSTRSGSSRPSAGPASGRAARAVAYARAQVGKRYQWGGAGPNAFDCSGLTMRAWQQAGVSLPHQSGAQYAATRRVPYSQVQPGDLLFFHSPIHHVGIYIGGGMMVHAQNSATGVVVSPVAGHWASRLTGVGRP